MPTNTQQKAPGACDSKGLHTDTNASYFASRGAIQQAHDGKTFTTQLTAAFARIKDAVSGFYLERGIGIEAVATLIVLAVFVTVRAFQ